MIRLATLLAGATATALAFDVHADDWQTARIVAAETVNTYNLVALELDELRIAAIYEALREARQASTLVIGESVQARIDGQRLEIAMPSGGTVKAAIAQRALIGVDTPLPSLAAAIESAPVVVPVTVPGPATTPAPAALPPLVPPPRPLSDLIP